MQNIIAPKLTLIEDPDKYPLSSTLGFSYRFFSNKLLTAVDLNKTENRQVKVHLGTEYTLARLFSIRAGLDETEAAFGLGVKWQNYSLDYAFAYHDAWKGYEDLGASHRFGLTMRWGSTKQIVANSSELVEKAENHQLTTNYKLPATDSSSDSELLSAEVAATSQVRGDAQETTLTEEILKRAIKEQIEKQTGEKVSNIEIEEMAEIAPAKFPDNISTYVVKSGDCLWDIAGKPEIYNNSWNWMLIYEANKEQIKNPDLIYPGQVLKTPLKR